MNNIVYSSDNYTISEKIEALFQDLVSRPGIEYVIICSSKTKEILKSTLPPEKARNIVEKIFDIYSGIIDRLKKYGKGASKLASLRIYFDNGKYLYLIRGDHILTIILQKSSTMSATEEFLAQILRKIEQNLETI
ncbi:MAG: hypothetical protein ACTSX9_03590 [Candidatus Njordarchaeales archaeon]